jgi:hypothetical protein
MSLIDKYPGLVHRHYSMDKDFERLEPDATKLENGMIVLVAAVIHRCDVLDKTEKDFPNTPSFLQTNRWCTVKDFQVYDSPSGKRVSFTGVYRDGREFVRICRPDTAWLVKKVTFDNPAVIANRTRQTIEEIVLEALTEQRNGNDAIGKLAESASVKIMEAFKEEQL